MGSRAFLKTVKSNQVSWFPHIPVCSVAENAYPKAAAVCVLTQADIQQRDAAAECQWMPASRGSKPLGEQLSSRSLPLSHGLGTGCVREASRKQTRHAHLLRAVATPRCVQRRARCWAVMWSSWKWSREFVSVEDPVSPSPPKPMLAAAVLQGSLEIQVWTDTAWAEVVALIYDNRKPNLGLWNTRYSFKTLLCHTRCCL